MFTALSCLRSVAICHAKLRIHAANSVNLLVVKCCEFITQNTESLRKARQSSPHQDAIVSSAYSCILEWVTSAPWIMESNNVVKAVVEVAVEGADIRIKTPPSVANSDNSLRLSARLLLTAIMKHHVYFPNGGSNILSRSSLLQEKVLRSLMENWLFYYY